MARTYDPGTGRYLEADRIGLRGGWNPYRYASNRPTVEIDPGGLQSAWPPTPKKLRALRGRAFAFGESLGLGPAGRDAFAHCVGACWLASDYGRLLARDILDLYEIDTARRGDQQSDDLDMDLHNNAIGLRLSGTAFCDANCAQDCYTALQNHQLRTDGLFEGDNVGPWTTYWRITRHRLSTVFGDQ